MDPRQRAWRDILARLPDAMAGVPLDDRPFPRALRDPEWRVEAVPAAPPGALPEEWPDFGAILRLLDL